MSATIDLTNLETSIKIPGEVDAGSETTHKITDCYLEEPELTTNKKL